MDETIISIEGMMCEHCQMAVTKALSELDGVTDVEVSLDPGQAKVYYDSSKTQVRELKAVINEAGYQA